MFTPNSPKVVDDKKLEQEIRDFRKGIGEKI